MNINFENCLTILQKVYDLESFFDYTSNESNEIYKRCFFIIIKIEINRKLPKDNSYNICLDHSSEDNKKNLAKNNSIIKRPTNHIEYLIFNGKNYKLLNTSYCKDLNVKILHFIVEKDIIDLNTSQNLYEKYNIDVFMPSVPFFNDICKNFTSNHKKKICHYL